MFRDIFVLTLVSSFRFFGLFIALPAIGLYASSFQTSVFLAGVAAGGYAITQIVFQTPFGIWSDKSDRKAVIIVGLIIFIIGSLICAFSTSISMLIIGRFIQGAGAISGIISAQIADLVREEERTKAMAIMGVGIFISFIFAMILGPIFAANMGLNSIFFLTAGLNFIALLILIFKAKSSPKVKYSYQENRLGVVFANKNLQILNCSVFLQKFFMILSFVVMGIVLEQVFSLEESQLWKIYAPGSILGLLALAPASILAQKKGYYKQVLLVGVVMFALAYVLFAYAIYVQNLIFFVFGAFVFFVGFSIHEPIMQTLASRYPKAHQKGAVLGFFTTLGFVGSAFGAMCGGIMYEYLGLYVLSISIVGICAFWILLMVWKLDNPIHDKNLYLPMRSYNLENFSSLNDREGVIEWYINITEEIIVVKYDEQIISKDEVLKVIT
ncbi:MAG: MFS transporter [Helicobacter sp.]|nr:MFS transporter [Helicobacter sp.]MDY5740846.1 MFS transporter [Helicobacter sp.]